MKRNDEEFYLDDFAPEIVAHAKPGDVIWSYCNQGHVFKATVITTLEGPEDPTYEVNTEHTEGSEKEYIPVCMAFTTQEDAMLAALQEISGNCTQFCANLMHSFTGEAPTGYLLELHKAEPRFKVGDTVWFQQPHCEYNTYKGKVTAMRKVSDPFDPEQSIQLYTIESRREKRRKKHTQQLTDYNVFGSYNQSKMAYAARIMSSLVMGLQDSIQELVGTEEPPAEAADV